MAKSWDKAIQTFLSATTNVKSNIVIAICSIATLLATVVGVGTSIGLWITTKHSVDLSAEVFRKSLRPHLGLGPRVVVKRGYADSLATRDSACVQMELHVTLKNFGTAPATLIRQDWVLNIAGKEIPDQSPKKDLLLFPGDDLEMVYTRTDSAFINVEKGRSRFSMYFRIRYYGATADTYYTYQEFNYLTGGAFETIRGYRQ